LIYFSISIRLCFHPIIFHEFEYLLASFYPLFFQFSKVILLIFRFSQAHWKSHYFNKILGDLESNQILVTFFLLKNPPPACMADSLMGIYFTKKIWNLRKDFRSLQTLLIYFNFLTFHYFFKITNLPLNGKKGCTFHF
jgi:hypothetical protein